MFPLKRFEIRSLVKKKIRPLVKKNTEIICAEKKIFNKKKQKKKYTKKKKIYEVKFSKITNSRTKSEHSKKT